MKRLRIVVVGLSLLLSLPAWAANKAGIVIQNSTGEVITRCLEFEQETLTVHELLEKSGFKLVTEEFSFGSMICYLHNDGQMDCSDHPEGWFWNFYQHDGTNWTPSDTGISSTEAHHGDIFGFVFGEWNKIQPPSRTYADVCEVTSAAGLVVDHSDGRRVTKTILFPGETTTGLQLLQRSGLSLVTNESSFGVAICSIDGEWQPAENCFGDPDGRFWAFSILNSANQWEMAPAGPADMVVRDQDVHGYYYCVWGTTQPPIRRADIFEYRSCVSLWEDYQ